MTATFQVLPIAKNGISTVIDILKNREMFAQRFRGKGLEFGAQCNSTPVAAQMSYADYLSTDQLQARYPMLSGMVNVDYVLRSDDLSEIPDGEFDFVIANPVIEHLVNPIKGVRSWAAKLKPFGSLMIGWPSPEYCPDAPRRMTPLSHLLDEFQRDEKVANDEHRLSFTWAWNPAYFPDPAAVEHTLKQMWQADRWYLNADDWSNLGANGEAVERVLSVEEEIHHDMFDVDTVLSCVREADSSLAAADITLGWGLLNEAIVESIKLPPGTEAIATTLQRRFVSRRVQQEWAASAIAGQAALIQDQRRILDERLALIKSLKNGVKQVLSSRAPWKSVVARLCSPSGRSRE